VSRGHPIANDASISHTWAASVDSGKTQLRFQARASYMTNNSGILAVRLLNPAIDDSTEEGNPETKEASR
jgi:hypothetical protein